MSVEIKIGKRIIGEQHPTLLVAEMSGNHNQDFDTAVKIIEAAAKAGADAVKLQTYTPDTITINCRDNRFLIGGDENPDAWEKLALYDLYVGANTPWEWHKELKELVESLGLIFFSTPFDHTAVDFLEDLGVPCYKIAAYEATDITLLRKVASTGKPVIMSVGFATLEEIELSVKTLRENGNRELVLLHCTTSYSDAIRAQHTNLRTMLDLKRFGVLSGFSDNMGGIEAPILASAMGASIVEKHLVLKHDPSIVDDKFSIDPSDFEKMARVVRRNEEIVGKVSYGTQTEAEEHNQRFRRSLFAVTDIKKDEVFTNENMRSIRPADGLETKYYDDVLGKKATQDIAFGAPLDWKLIQGGKPSKK